MQRKDPIFNVAKNKSNFICRLIEQNIKFLEKYRTFYFNSLQVVELLFYYFTYVLLNYQ